MNTEELTVADELKIEDNLIPFSKQHSSRPRVRRYKQVKDVLHTVDGMLDLADMVMDSLPDYDLYSTVKNWTNTPLEYDEDFLRKTGLSIYKGCKKDYPREIASLMEADFCEVIGEALDANFVVDNGKLTGHLIVVPAEPGISIEFKAAFTPEVWKRHRAACVMRNFVDNFYLEYWHKQGYKYMYADSFTPKGKSYISNAGRRQSKPYSFSYKEGLKITRYENKLHTSAVGRWDLSVIFGTQRSKKKGERKGE